MSHTSNKPIKEHLHDFLDWLDVEKGLSTRTQENYSRFLKRFFDWLSLKKLSTMKPHEFTADHIWDYRIFLARQTSSKRSSEPLYKSTQNYYLIVIRSLLAYFVEKDILAISPDKVKLARDRGEKEVRFLTLQQLERLFLIPNTKTKIGLRDRALIETLFSTALRVSEIAALDKVQIESLLQNNNTELSITGKGKRVRTVYFSDRALSWLKKYLEIRKDTEDPLFINYRGPKDASRRLTIKSIENLVKHYALRAGLPKNTTPHVMRHSFATDMLGRGVDIRTLQEFLGHKSIAATQIYTHVTSKQLKDIHKKFHGGGSAGEKL